MGTTLEDYALKTEIPTDFYTKEQSDQKYQVIGDYVTNDALTIKLADYVTANTLASYSTTEQMNAAINTAITGAIEGAY